MKTYTIKCPDCGVVENNISAVACDICGKYAEEIKLGDTWYSADDLDASNPYNQ